MLRRVVAVLGLALLALGLSLVVRTAPVEAAGQDEILVRAQGDSGEERMALIVNGNRVADWTVTTNAASYRYDVDSPLAIDSVEVRFLNDAAGRDLDVDYINVGGTTLQSESSSTISTGTYIRGEGCRERAATSATLHCNGSFNYDISSGVVLGGTNDMGPRIAIRALGTSGAEQFQVRINNAVVLSDTVGTSWNIYTTSLPADTDVTKAEVQFVNDAPGRDLRVDYFELDGQRYESESSATVSNGTWRGGACDEGPSTSDRLHCSGWFRYDITNNAASAPAAAPAASTTTTTTAATEPAAQSVEVVVRALGRSGDEDLQLRINGAAVASWTVTKQFTNYTHSLPANAELDQIEVQFVNDGGDRDLRVDFIEVDGERFQAESSRTLARGTYTRSTGCAARASTSEWLHCAGSFTFNLDGSAASAPAASSPDAPVRQGATADPEPVQQPLQTPSNPNARYSIAEVIDGTIGAGDGSNPNEEAPMGRHDAPLYLPQGWNWSQGPTRNSVWGQLGTGGSQYAEWRCAVIPENGHRPSVPFRINVSEGAYYQFANGSWDKAFDVDLTGGNHGGYLGQAGQLNQNPFSSGSHGLIQWRQEADGSFSAPWNSNALMMHFWAGKREAPASGQTAEFLTSEVRLQQPDGTTVDLSKVQVLFQCGIDYYNTTGGQGTQVPGPGIAKYHRVTTDATPGLWVTLPRNAPANSVGDFERWLENNTPPQVG